MDIIDIPYEGCFCDDDEYWYVEEFIENNVYPDFEEMSDRLVNEWSLEGEYGEDNHNYCETMYYNIFDDDCIYEMGEKIYEKGGLYAMMKNYETLIRFSPFAYSDNKIIRSYCRRIQIIWENIGGWKY
jgi:hypothetical protein